MPIAQRYGATSRARRALSLLESQPSADSLAAARRALVRLRRVAANPREVNAIGRALEWLAYGFDTGFDGANVPDKTPIIKNACGWLNHGFPLQVVPATIGENTRRTHAQRCNETGQIFASFADARRVLGISRGDMAKYRNGTADHAGGFTFERVPLLHARNDWHYEENHTL